jgi:hypothetical protein
VTAETTSTEARTAMRWAARTSEMVSMCRS